MCRWLAYSGSPIKLEALLLDRDRSLIDQSLHSRLGATTTNGDGFGVGWYDEGDTPRLYRSVHPAWNDRNLRELAGGVSSHLFLAHIRASTGTAIQETNAHPFRYGRWLWMHNGLIREFPTLRRELMMAIDESLFSSVEGTTDSETMFYLALTFGLETDPVGAVEKMVGLVEETGRRHGVEHPIQMTIGTSDGSSVYAFRYSSEGDSRSLYFSTRMDALRHSIPRSRISRRCRTRRESSSPSRSGTSRAPGTRFPSPTSGSSSRERTSYDRSHRTDEPARCRVRRRGGNHPHRVMLGITLTGDDRGELRFAIRVVHVAGAVHNKEKSWQSDPSTSTSSVSPATSSPGVLRRRSSIS